MIGAMTPATLTAAGIIFLCLGITARAKPAPTPCPGMSSIRDCRTPCSGNAKLNKQKNVRSKWGPSALRTIAWMRALPNPSKADCLSRNTARLRQLGEGQKITVVGQALAARAGSPESCNCYLRRKEDKDNHIVLVDPSLRHPTLTNNEQNSVTVEFTPRVRLRHPNFTQEKLEPLIDPTWRHGQTCKRGKLLVRVTGVLMFDTEHYCVMPKLKRATNWEIHPILKFEYCAKGKTCRADSDENWIDFDDL
jgi:hypothetical protein